MVRKTDILRRILTDWDRGFGICKDYMETLK